MSETLATLLASGDSGGGGGAILSATKDYQSLA
jgi:hypothetical protein